MIDLARKAANWCTTTVGKQQEPALIFVSTREDVQLADPPSTQLAG